MTLMGGFDLVTEISKITLLNTIRRKMLIGAVSINPPFALNIPVTYSEVTAVFRVIVNDIKLDLIEDQNIKLTMTFNNSSIIVSSPTKLTMAALDGQITITSTVKLAGSAIVSDYGVAITTINFTPDAEKKISAVLIGSSLTAPIIIRRTNESIQNMVRKSGTLKFIERYTVVPGKNGSISPLQFERLELFNIDNQSLGLFGILFLKNHFNGDHKSKSTSITKGNDVCVNISAEAFRSFIFCPSVAKSLGKDVKVSDLPPSCASTGGVEKDGVSITNISDIMGTGRIQIYISFSKSGFCYEARGLATGDMTLSISGTKVTPKIAFDPPKVDIQIDFWCVIPSLIFGGPIGAIGLGVIAAIGVGIAEDLTESTLSTMSNSLKASDLGGASGASFDQVEIIPEGITFNGKLPVRLPLIKEERNLEINGSVVTTSIEILRRFTHIISKGCMKGSYPAIEQAQQQMGIYQIIPKLLGTPLTYEFRIEYYIGSKFVSSTPLLDTKGTITLSNVEAHFGLGSVVVTSVHIGYEILEDIVQLTNVPNEGNYNVLLVVRVTDPTGSLETKEVIEFQGNIVIMGGEYQSKAMWCFLKYVEERNRRSPINRFYVRWPAVNHPPPEEIIDLVHFLASQATPEADDLLIHTKLAHGDSFYRALVARQGGDVVREIEIEETDIK